MHPYINKLIADERVATMRAEAAADGRAREVKANKRKSAKLRAAREQAPRQLVPAQRGGRSSSEPVVGHLSREDIDRLVSAGKARGDQRQ